MKHDIDRQIFATDGAKQAPIDEFSDSGRQSAPKGFVFAAIASGLIWGAGALTYWVLQK